MSEETEKRLREWYEATLAVEEVERLLAEARARETRAKHNLIAAQMAATEHERKMVK